MPSPSDGVPVRPPLRAPPCAEGAPTTRTSPSVWKEVSRKGKTDRLIHSRLNDRRLLPLVKIQPVHLVSFKPVRTLGENLLPSRPEGAFGFSFDATLDEDYTIFSTLEDVETASVPEAASNTLLGIGLVLMFGPRRLAER